MTLRPPLRSLLLAVLLVAAPPAASQVRVELPARDVAAPAPRALFSVGVEDGAEWEMFGAVGDVAFDGTENLYVLDRMNARVVVFDARGGFVRAIGRRGGGPGEFSAPQQMAIGPAGELVVSDVGRRAFVVFSASGALLRTVPFGAGSLPIGRPLAAHPRGGFVSRAMGNPASRAPTAFGDEVLLRYPAGGGVPRPLLEISLARDRLPQGGGATLARAPLAFAPGFHFGVLPDGSVAVADGAAYSVRILGPDGRVARVISRPIAPRRVTARDREAELERRSRAGGLSVVGAGPGGASPQVRRSVQASLGDIEFAEVVPVIAGMSVDASGNLWLKRSGARAGQDGPIDVVTPAGRYLLSYSALPLPMAFSRGGRAAYVVTDELGVQRVVVVRL